MRSLKVALAALAALASARALAFHAGGVGDCDGCHSVHGTPDAQPSAYLLQHSDASSVCLNCHAAQASAGQQPNPTSPVVMTTSVLQGSSPRQFTPGGDFGWIAKSFVWTEGTASQTSPGERHGHNVVAVDFGLSADATHVVAPGGSYRSESLSCISCHDPHGRYKILDKQGTIGTADKPSAGSGSYGDGTNFREPTEQTAVGTYRLLAGKNYKRKGETQFATDPPIAVAPSRYNMTERASDVRVAYGTGFSEWCANCHGAFHGTSGSGADFLHVSGNGAKLGALVIDNYNKYIKTGVVLAVPDPFNSYTSMVPYEEGITDRARLAEHALSDGSANGRVGPSTGQENVTCLSCHRAHASGWDHATRWNTVLDPAGGIVMEGAWPGTDAVGIGSLPQFAQGRTQAETRGAMYDREASTYAAFQKSLCNKCHIKD